MKVIDRSTQGGAGRKPKFLGQAQKLLGNSGVQKEIQAQDTVIEVLQRVLDNRYTLVRNVPIEGQEVPVTMVLVGPSGVRVLNTSSIKGIYRAREDTWEEMNNTTQRFKPAKPNLLAITRQMSQAIEGYLNERGYELPPVEPVLVFSDPGVHVDTSRPLVRIVLADAVDRFANGVMQGQPVMEKETAQRLAEGLGMLGREQEEEKPAVDERDAFSFKDMPEKKPARSAVQEPETRSGPTFTQRIPFTNRQWVMLGLLVLVNIIVLTAFVLFILFSG